MKPAELIMYLESQGVEFQKREGDLLKKLYGYDVLKMIEAKQDKDAAAGCIIPAGEIAGYDFPTFPGVGSDTKK